MKSIPNQTHQRLLALADVKIVQLLQRKISANVPIQHEERTGVPRSDLVPEVVHTTGRTQRRELLQIANVHIVQILHVAHELLHLRGRVEAQDQNLLQFLDANACLDMVLDDRFSRDREQRFRGVQ